MKKLIQFLNTLPTVKAALIMGGFMFAGSSAGAAVGRLLANRELPKVTLRCVCEP